MATIVSTLENISRKFDQIDSRFDAYELERNRPLMDQKTIDDMVKALVEERLKIVGKIPENYDNLSNGGEEESLPSPQQNTQQKYVNSPSLVGETPDKAHQWEKTLPSDTVTTWEECKRAFLDKFFSTSRTTKIKNEISGKESLLSIFYRGALPQCRNMLDTASNGFFLGRTEEEAEELVENMAKSDSVYSEEHDRVNRSDDQQTKKEINQEVPPKVNEVDGFEGQEELCFINNNGTWYRKKPNFQYNNYQQRSYSNNQQGGYQPKQNIQQGAISLAKSPTRVITWKARANPMETMKAITLQSGRELPPRVLTKDGEKQGGEVAINIDDEVVIVDEKVDEEILEKIVEAKGKGKVGQEKRTVKHGETATPTKESSFVTMPIIDAFMFVPQYGKFLKDVVAAKKKEIEGMMILTHECSAIIQRLDVPRKLEDPGCFTLPCALGPMVFERCLCDLGASVSLMPLFIAKKLGFTQYKKCRLSLVLADRSVKIPVGILEDLPLMVGNFEIPTNFVVLEMGEEARDPLILGRPFLTTAGAFVNVREGKIDLHL
ncbi:PREDICTED: uncharacterized protein LOC106338838 [Brassica oleracea var. oleracea]|uniref:uncharacterized protein LOC106338838 n=1 Tax=Brassica oleracea var. oleracea TaxID=109376 RepID=UPI0006A703BD|nr:PREDICTED: uncharacterized protein LOC106338838 [Brassica oleracea var. oleracea]